MGFLEWIKSDHVVFSDGEADRYFLGCRSCRRVRPYYELVATKRDAVMQCESCGDNHVRPVPQVSWWTGCWHVLIRGYLWRHILRGKVRQEEWDPRMPYFSEEFKGFA